MKKPAAALFDLDGVLIDTEPLYTQIWSDIDREFPTGVDSFAFKIKGSTLPRILNTYYPDADLQRAVTARLHEREDAMVYPLFAGTIAFLEELKARGVPCAIVTSSGDKKMRQLAEAQPYFYSFFDTVITDSCVKNSKPHPEGYLLAANRLNARPEECIVVEDSYAGLQAGRAAGAKVVALATTNAAETLVDKADIVLGDISELSLEALQSIL